MSQPQPIRPPRLSHGSRLGIIATSTPIDILHEPTIQRGYQRLADLGLEVVEAPNCRHQTTHTAGTIQDRVQAIHDFLIDDTIHAIMAFWGGHQTHQLLEYLDFDLFAAHPKPIIGYSDTTALLNVITARTGLITFSGPAVITFAKPTLLDYTTHYFKKVLFEPATELEFHAAKTISTNLWYEHDDLTMLERPSTGWKTFHPGHARGRLFGGNLGTLLLLAGTPYWPDLTDTILFVEEDESESPETINRVLTQLRHMGIYDQIAGMLIGRFPDSVHLTPDNDITDILKTALKGYDIPVLYDVDFGHTDPLLTLPIGTLAELDTTIPHFRLLEPCTTNP